jgi:AcrR family transcriptional regulator
MARPRGSQTQKSLNSQTAMLEAAVSVLIDLGFAQFTTTEVATRAGMSRGAQLNYFPTRNALLVATTKYTLSNARDQAMIYVGRAMATKNPLPEYFNSLIEFFLTGPYRAMLEMTISARADPELAREVHPVVRQYRELLDNLWEDTLCKAGFDREKVKMVIEVTNNFFRGLASTQVWMPNEHVEKLQLDFWRKSVEQMLR